GTTSIGPMVSPTSAATTGSPRCSRSCDVTRGAEPRKRRRDANRNRSAHATLAAPVDAHRLRMGAAVADAWPARLVVLAEKESKRVAACRLQRAAHMKSPIRITYRHMASSEAIDDFVNARVAKLERIYDGIVSCQVTLDRPHRHHRHGGHYHVG